MCDKLIKAFAGLTILLGLATLCPCTAGQCRTVQTSDSNAIAEIIYHPSSQEMIVVFRDDAQYSFKDIPEATFESFKNAKSKGKFFGEKIRGHFETSHHKGH